MYFKLFGPLLSGCSPTSGLQQYMGIIRSEIFWLFRHERGDERVVCNTVPIYTRQRSIMIFPGSFDWIMSYIIGRSSCLHGLERGREEWGGEVLVSVKYHKGAKSFIFELNSRKEEPRFQQTNV